MKTSGSVTISPIFECAEWILRVTCEGEEVARESHPSYEDAASAGAAWLRALGGFSNIDGKAVGA